MLTFVSANVATFSKNEIISMLLFRVSLLSCCYAQKRCSQLDIV